MTNDKVYMEIPLYGYRFTLNGTLHWLQEHPFTYHPSVHGDLCDMVFINAFNNNNNHGKTQIFFLDLFV